MKKLLFSSCLSVGTVSLLLLSITICRADVLFIHDYRATQYMVGKQDADLLIGYTDQAMYFDKKIRYTGEMMKTLLGKVQEGRETSHFLLDRDQIREMDYHKSIIYIFPFNRLTDINWIRQKQKLSEREAKIIEERYRVLDPRLSVRILPQKEKVNGYLCQVVEADLRLETLDLKRNSSSVTLISQKLWVSEDVPGYAQYSAFHEKLSKRLGFEAVRLGGLSAMLRYWDGSLEPIRKSIENVRGYPVRSVLRAEGRYTAGVGTGTQKTHSMALKEEDIDLREALTDRPVAVRFPEPAGFRVTVVE